MFVKPSELQAQIDRRAQEKPVGHKKHKQAKQAKGKGKGFGVPPLTVDPTSLRLEHGIFQSETGQPLAQLGLSQVGPTVAGVVVVSGHAIDPLLESYQSYLFWCSGLLCCGLGSATKHSVSG